MGVDVVVVPLEDHKTRIVALYSIYLGGEDLQAEHLGGQLAGYGGGVAQTIFGDVSGAESRVLALDELPRMAVEEIDTLQQSHGV